MKKEQIIKIYKMLHSTCNELSTIKYLLYMVSASSNDIYIFLKDLQRQRTSSHPCLVLFSSHHLAVLWVVFLVSQLPVLIANAFLCNSVLASIIFHHFCTIHHGSWWRITAFRLHLHTAAKPRLRKKQSQIMNVLQICHSWNCC